MIARQWFFKHVVASTVIIFLTLVSFFPFLRHPNTLITDPADAVLAVWTMHRVQDNILSGRNIFDGNIFYPHQSTILFSDTFVPMAILSFPVRLLTREPLPLFTYSMVLSQILTAIGVYLLCLKVLPKDRYYRILLSITAAIVFSFSQVHFHYYAHLHVFALQWILFAWISLFEFEETGKGKWLLWTVFWTALQIWQSIFLAYAVVLTIPFFLLSQEFRTQLIRSKKSVLFSALLFVVLITPLAMGYVHFYQTYHSTRDIREVIHFSMIPKDIIGKFFSPAIYLFVIGALWIRLRKFLKTIPLPAVLRTALQAGRLRFTSLGMTSMYALISLSFLILSFGPALHIGEDTVKLMLGGHIVHIPLPYIVFYYLAPGFQAFRTPSRFFPLTLLFALVWSISILGNSKISRRTIVLICSVLVAITLIAVPTLPQVQLQSRSQYPAFVSFLKSRPEKVVLYLPMRDWAEKKLTEVYPQMLYSLEDGKTLVNGQSGFYPPEWVEFLKLSKSFPNDESIQAMRNRGVELIVVDKKETKGTLLLPLLFEDDTSAVYKVKP